MPLVVGFIRSGTTLLRLMLDSHSALVIPPETSFPESLFCAALESSGEVIGRHVIASKKWPDLGLPQQEYLSACVGLSGVDALRLVWESYRRRSGKAIIGDKSPGYIHYLGAVASVLPEVRVIHLIRDGRDCYASQLNSRFSLYSTAIRSPEEQAISWASAVIAGRGAGLTLPNYIEVRFEDLIQSPETVLTGICAFLDIPFDPAMLHYHEHADARLRELGNRAVAGQRLQEAAVRQGAFDLTRVPPDRLRIGRWMEVLLPWELASFEAIAGPLLEDLGYDSAARRLAQSDPELADHARQAAARCLALGDYAGVRGSAIKALRADPQDPRQRMMLRDIAEWTLDLPVQWCMDVLTDEALSGRFGEVLPVWRGELPSAGRRLLVWRSHKDLGADLRYSAALTNLGDLAPHCVVEVDARVLPLLRRRFPDLDIRPRDGERAPGLAFHASWELLAHYLLPSPAAMPKTPWLIADRDRVEGLRKRPFPRSIKPLVALAWHSTNTDKCLPPLSDWRHVLGVTGIDFVSAQYGVDPRLIGEWGRLGRRVRTEPVDLFADVDALGALLASCDLLVTISGTQAHLAGGLGVPSWVLMFKEPRLSWPLGRDTTPWYPATRLVWVRERDQWEQAMRRLAGDLRSWAWDWRRSRLRDLAARFPRVSPSRRSAIGASPTD